MDYNNFISEYKIGSTSPTDPSRTLMHARAFGEAIYEFVDSGFRAAAEVNVNIKSSECIMLTTDYMALFFRTLFTSIFGRVYLKIDISEINGIIIMDISADEPMPLTNREINTLIKIARNAGMEVASIDGRLTFTLEFSKSEEYSVYAGDFFSGKRTMHMGLCKIFFS